MDGSNCLWSLDYFYGLGQQALASNKYTTETGSVYTKNLEQASFRASSVILTCVCLKSRNRSRYRSMVYRCFVLEI